MRGRGFVLILLMINLQANAGLLDIPLDQRIELTADQQIELCWFTAKDSKTRPLQIKIETFLAEQLLKNAGLKISFVGLCLQHSNPMGPIGIGFFDDEDNTAGIQNTLRGLAPKDFPGHPTTYHQGVYTTQNLVEVVLSSRLQEVRPSLLEQAANLSEQGLESLFLSIALHEVLHALGVSHEHNRPDSLCNLEKDKKFHQDSNTLIGAYDPESLMNPCYTKQYDFEKGPIVLSQGDIMTVQYLYGF